MVDASSALLSLQNLVVRYEGFRNRSGLTAVRGVSLDVWPGQIHALVGESGSGKTSLARAVLRLVPVESGRMVFRGTDLAHLEGRALRRARKHVQAVFQDPQASLSPRRRILQTLREPLDHFRLGRPAERKARAAAALEAVGLDPELLRRFPHELSGGQRQRVALARALISEPELIVADEPLSSLDVSAQSRLIGLVRELRDSRSLAFLFVTHDLSVVRRLADHVSVMYLGELVESAPARSMFANPAHPYTRALLASVPVPDPEAPAPVAPGGEAPSALTPPAGCVFHGRCPERMEACATVPPGVAHPGGLAEEHRVKCHLWNR